MIGDTLWHKKRLDSRLAAHELEIARQLQQSLLPRSFPALPGFGFAAFCRSASQVGGDFYDILSLADDSVLLVVADVMGKGVPAALFAATLRTLVRATLEWTQRPSELLARMNRLMYQELSGVDMFITAQLALVEPRRQLMSIASAGHCPLLLADGQGNTRAISPDGLPLGIMPNAVFAEQEEAFDSSNSALLYTDGLTDARNPQGRFFGPERLEHWLRHSAGKKRNADQLKASFVWELERFQSERPPEDDQTFLLLAGEARKAATLAQPLGIPQETMCAQLSPGLALAAGG
jgi:serine phosphatase RsbU (regulator of sigma subunit)